MSTLFSFVDTSKFRSIDMKTKLHALRIKESMAPEPSTFRPTSTKNQRADLISELDNFQASLRKSNASAFNKVGLSTSISKQGTIENSYPKGLEGLEKTMNFQMKNFHQDLKSNTTHSPFLKNKSPSKIKVYQHGAANISNSPFKRTNGDSFRPILSSSIFKRQLKEDVSNVVDSIAPISPLKKPRKSSAIQQHESIKLDFGGFGKLSSSNFKTSGSLAGFFNNETNDYLLKNSGLNKNASIFNTLKKKDAKAFFNESKGLDNKGFLSRESPGGLYSRESAGGGLQNFKMSFLKERESVGGGLDMRLIYDVSEKIRGLQSKEIENLSNMQVKELLTLANLITKIVKNSKYYS